jgi:hypothetical protein
MAINHVSLPISTVHYKVTRDFYLAILKPLGYTIFMEDPTAANFCGFHSKRGGPDFWLHGGGTENITLFDGDVVNRSDRPHIAFEASSKALVDEWYQNALYNSSRTTPWNLKLANTSAQKIRRGFKWKTWLPECPGHVLCICD